jgi:poly-gamma-glutamate synthesis protein (capsule biosynthesis protein)
MRVLLTGDLILDEPEPDSFFEPARGVLGSGDIVIGHVEVPHTRRGREASSDIPAPPADPAHLATVGRAGFDVVTLAGNHMFDAGSEGVEDTIAGLTALGIRTTGAGRNLDEARRPATIEHESLRLGVLSYNCVGPVDSWASPTKAGCAYVEVTTNYTQRRANPGGPPEIRTSAEKKSLEGMQADVAALRGQVDVLVVALHKGLVHAPAKLADYDLEVSHAAIDAGADVVVGHHAHILKGIEVYRGRPIFHGLGNFVTVTRALSLEANPSLERLAWARRRREIFGFEPDPNLPAYPFHPESRNTMIADCRFDRDGLRSAGFVPCWINDQLAPTPVGRGEQGEAVAAYVEKITGAVGLATEFWWDGEVVRFF